eukprot:gene2138-4169_t
MKFWNITGLLSMFCYRASSWFVSHIQLNPSYRGVVGRSGRSVSLTTMASSSGPPDVPKSFGKYFKLPKIQSNLQLEIANPHKNDKFIKFDEKNHRYTVKNDVMSVSVTKMVEAFFEEFQPDIVAERMMGSNNWPRDDYRNKDGEPMTAEEIKKKWEGIGEYARNYGSWIHLNIELYLNDLEPAENIPELDQFYKFEEEYMMDANITPYRTEWRIAAPDKSLAGSVDFVGKLEDGTYCIIDWKTSKNLSVDKLNNNKFQKYAKPPLDNLDDTDFVKYYLQLNIYRYILQKYYDLTISKMILTSFHKTFDNYFMIEVPVMEREVELMIEAYIESKASSPNNDKKASSDDFDIPF